MKKIGILGAGTWGTALARMLSKSGNAVTVWSAIEDEIISLSKCYIHPNLSGIKLPRDIVFTSDISSACREKDIIIIAVPSVFVRETTAKAARFITENQTVVCVAKGIEKDTMMFMSEVISDEMKKAGIKTPHVVALSGPTHAEEVAMDIPTAIVSACENENDSKFVQDVFMNTCLRVYTNTDIRGVELCGAVKNVIALAAGISDGLGYGDNTKAALLTRGVAELVRLGNALNCNPSTFYGLAGIGDLIVTSTSIHSRNYRAGHLIGQGIPVGFAVKQIGMAVEGINALPAAVALSAKYNVEMPIISAIDQIINYDASPAEMVLNLMTRNKNSE